MTWNLARLGQICRVESGAGFPLEFQGLTDQQYPFFKVGDMNTQGNEVEMRVHQHSISEVTRKKLRAKAFGKGSVIFPKIGAAIATNKKRKLIRPSCVDNNVMVLNPLDKLDSDYLYYLFVNKNLSDFASTGNPPSIRKTTIEAWKIPLPPIEEQRRIAGILARADRLRQLRRYALQLSDGYLQSVFLQMFGDPVTNPMGWEIRPLGDLIVGFEGGVNFPPVSEGDVASDWRVLKISSVTWGDFNPLESKPIKPNVKFDDSLIVRKGDLIISRANTTELVGAVSMVRQSPPKVLLPDKLWRIKIKEGSNVLPDFVLFVLRQDSLRQIIGDLATGSSGSMKNISKAKAATLPIPLASMKLQEQFTCIVNRYERLRSQQREAARQADHLFATLLHRAFRGEL